MSAGAGSSVGADVAVPEPTGFVLALVGMLLADFGSRASRSHISRFAAHYF
jgi:hypothetical protein